MEVVAVQTRDEACGAEALGERNAARGEQTAGEAERLGKRQPPEIEARRVADLERHAQQRVVLHADRAHHAIELGVGADQDVLAVVELRALARYAPGAAAWDGTGLEYRHTNAALGEQAPAGIVGDPAKSDVDAQVWQRVDLRAKVRLAVVDFPRARLVVRREASGLRTGASKR